ncbi:MAG: trigger factor [Gammaproteobacteria bacterium]|jgi:trigger factor|nr:trigger factor [Gammaproteobacteria bacterium]
MQQAQDAAISPGNDELQVALEAGAGLERRLKVRVPAQRIEKAVEARLRSVGRTANLKGFRPGKVPDKVIRQRFGDQIRREVLQDLVQSTYGEALSREQLRPAGEPRIDATAGAEEAGDFAYTASFEVFPEFAVQGLDGIAVSRPDPAFDDADIDFISDSLRRQRSHWHPTDREARKGDRVVVDFQGRMNGAPMAGGIGEKVTVELGAGRMVEDFERQLAGLKAGDQREIQVRFPGDYPNRELAGQTADFSVQVQEVSEQHLPEIDEAFIRAFGVESGSKDDFVRELRDIMADEFSSRARAEVKRQLLEQVLAANPIDIPVILVEQEATALQSEAMRNLGVSDPGQAPALESFRQTAERRVRLGLIIGGLIREQQLVVDREKVRERIDQLSAGYDKPDEIRKLYYQTAQLLTQVENAVLEEQVVDWLAGRAATTTKPTTFRALVAG